MDISEIKMAQIENMPIDIKTKLLKKLGDCKYNTTFIVKAKVSLNGIINFYQSMSNENIDTEGALIRKALGDLERKEK